jgi:hypothetical protein
MLVSEDIVLAGNLFAATVVLFSSRNVADVRIIFGSDGYNAITFAPFTVATNLTDVSLG